MHRITIAREIIPGTGQGGVFARDVSSLAAYAGQVQCIYIDPPYATGQSMFLQTGKFLGIEEGSVPAYDDPKDPAEAEQLIRLLIDTAHTLLREDGLLFVHVDWRMSGRVRMLLDELFGEDHIVNELIWSYQTGGRATHAFSRKHDTIFMYRKGEDYSFYPDEVRVTRRANANHMKRSIDSDGRAYRSIRSGGREYRYYEDEPGTPGDVWDDLQMQQRDPQRIGYDTQKPIRLLERIFLCASRPGDLVADLCVGSGTAALAANQMNRRFLAVDPSCAAALCMRRRLYGSAMEIVTGPEENADMPPVAVRDIGFSDMRVTIDASGADSWAIGSCVGRNFYVSAQEMRTRENLALSGTLEMPRLDGELVLRLTDKQGRTSYFALDETDWQE